jgi:hypothetical protein
MPYIALLQGCTAQTRGKEAPSPLGVPSYLPKPPPQGTLANRPGPDYSRDMTIKASVIV